MYYNRCNDIQATEMKFLGVLKNEQERLKS